tara:strand:+ start:73 stop:330 length:258 start_codon:yes stop_codon:yes gene_type:complete
MLHRNAIEDIQKLQQYIDEDPQNAEDYQAEIDWIERESQWLLLIDNQVHSEHTCEEAAEDAMRDWILDNEKAFRTHAYPTIERTY